MPSLEKSRLIVLHLTKYSDAGVVLHTVDSQYGRRSFLVRGSVFKRPRTDFFKVLCACFGKSKFKIICIP